MACKFLKEERDILAKAFFCIQDMFSKNIRDFNHFQNQQWKKSDFSAFIIKGEKSSLQQLLQNFKTYFKTIIFAS